MNDSFFSDIKQNLSLPAVKLFQQAVDHMTKSKDPYHDVDHVKRMLKDFQRFLKENPTAKERVNVERMLLSISWHDVWKSQRIAKNLVEIIHHQFMDGIGSAKLFHRAAEAIGFEHDHLHHIAYSIRKHAHFQFLPIKTFEAKLLRDLDDLDLLSVERLNKGAGLYSHGAPWRVKVFRDAVQRQSLNLPWSLKQREVRSPKFFEAIDQLLSQKKR